MGLAALTRRKMVDTLRETGPDKPTLCEGWTTADLAGHLVVRDRRPDGLPGIALPIFAGHTRRLMDQVKTKPWDDVLDMVAAGPRLSPFVIPVLDELVNPVEFAIHREDARRGTPGYASEAPEPELSDLLWKSLRRQRRLLLRKSPAPLLLTTRDGHSVGPAEADVTLLGNPLELVLFCFGRQGAADVEVHGPDELVDQVKAAPFGA